MSKSNIYNLLQECKVEKDVEEKYKRVINEHFPKGNISSPYYTDGVLKNGLTMLMEFKYNLDLDNKLQVAEMLVQIIYYLKQFELHGEELPSIIFCGDINECFCLHSNILLPYLNEDIDWSLPPSGAASKNPELIKRLYNDQNINPFPFHINNDHFDFEYVVKKIKELHEGTIQKVRITELNINRFFSYFRDKIIKYPNKHTAEDLVAIYLNCLIDSQNNYPHPKKKNTLVTNIVGEIPMNGNLYNAFFDHFETSYSIEEKKRLTSISDRLIADEARRFQGEFYTPTEWVLEAHKMIEDIFGLNWKEEYVVWDPAWGTGNLTRDFKFKELYCSTLNHGDLQMAQHYNPEAVKFQYDFLNDDVTPDGLPPADGKIKLQQYVPELIKNIHKKNKIIVFCNFPFGKGSGHGTGKDTGVSLINPLMKKDKLGKPSAQLYAQFIYRLNQIQKSNKNIYLCIFTPTLFLTGSSYKNFRKLFLKNFCFLKGFVFNAGHFEGTSSSWSMLFSIWKPGENFSNNSFVCDIRDYDENKKIITLEQNKILYNSDNVIAANKWAKGNLEYKVRINAPILINSLTVDERPGPMMIYKGIGYFNCGGNNINTNRQHVGIYSSSYAGGGIAGKGYSPGWPLDNSNFLNSIGLFVSRTAIFENWINQKDEYLAPNEQHPDYQQWNTDAIIYSLFNNHSQQSSMRKITYKNKIWDIKNEWFWMSNEQMLQLANEHGFDELYHDANGDHDRFVFKKIQMSTFSQDAAEVYNKACQLVIKTFEYRQLLHGEHPEWHLNTWDAGWYQIKLILKKYFTDDLKDFVVLYKKFEDRMREGVYKFEFLK